jgi:hypothetical protein
MALRHSITSVLGISLLVCSPAVAAVIDFSALAAGDSVEGAGTVNSLLTITSSVGNGIALFSGQSPNTYTAGPGNTISSGGISPTGGFATNGSGFLQDFVFTFASGVTVDSFSLRVLDYGDLNGGNATQHTFGIKAFDALNQLVDIDSFFYTSDSANNPTSGSAGNLTQTGDALLSSGASPGNTLFTVVGSGIVRVEMFYDHNGTRPPGAASDARIGITDLQMNFIPAPGSIMLGAPAIMMLVRRRR